MQSMHLKMQELAFRKEGEEEEDVVEDVFRIPRLAFFATVVVLPRSEPSANVIVTASEKLEAASCPPDCSPACILI